MAQVKTAAQVIQAVLDEDPGYLELALEYWGRLHLDERDRIKVILLARGGSGGGVTIVDHGGYATLDDGTTEINVPIVDPV